MVFAVIDSLNNVNGSTADETDDLLFENKKIWIKTLTMKHHSSNSRLDLNRKKWREREKLNGERD